MIRYDESGFDSREEKLYARGWRVGVSSYQVPLVMMGPPDELAAACDAFSAERQLDLLVLMPSFDDDANGGAFTRQLAFVAAAGGGGVEGVLPGLIDAVAPDVGGLSAATEVKGPLAAMAFYVGDPKASRKTLQPLLSEYLSREGVARVS